MQFPHLRFSMDTGERQGELYGDGMWADCRLYRYNASWKRFFCISKRQLFYTLRPWVFFVFQFLVLRCFSNKPITAISWIDFPSAMLWGQYVMPTNGYGGGVCVCSSWANNHKQRPNRSLASNWPLQPLIATIILLVTGDRSDCLRVRMESSETVITNFTIGPYTDAVI